MAETKLREVRSYPESKTTTVGILPSDMQDLLEQMAPASASAALSALRRVFPNVPLKERVQACEAYARRVSSPQPTP